MAIREDIVITAAETGFGGDLTFPYAAGRTANSYKQHGHKLTLSDGTVHYETGDFYMARLGLTGVTVTVQNGSSTAVPSGTTTLSLLLRDELQSDEGVLPAVGLTAVPNLCHTGGMPARVSTDGTNLDIVITELYVAQVFIPCDMTVTGIAVMNGAAVAGNLKVMLFNSAGTRLAISAATAASGTDAYQRIAFSAAYAAKGPATYYVGVMGSDAGGDINTHVFGDFRAGKITGLVFATEAGYATITVPTSFTTGLGPIASLY